MEWIRQSWLDTLALTEDWMRSPEYREDIEMYCSHSFLSGRPAKQYRSPLAVGDTVRVTCSVCKGLVGELKVIDPDEPDENFFGIRFDAIEGWIFFRADEIERVENVDSAELPF